MAYWTDDWHLYVEQRRLDAQQAASKRSPAMTPKPMTQDEVLAEIDSAIEGINLIVRTSGLELTPHRLIAARATIAAWNVSPSADVVGDIAAIAHDGGLLNLSEHLAMVAIRRLTLPAWDKSGTESERAARLDAALSQLAQQGGESKDA